MRHEKLSLKWKVFQYLLSFTAILLVLLWMFQTVYLDAFYTVIKKNELEQALNILMDNLNEDDLGTMVNTISEEYEIYILISKSDGDKLYDSIYFHTIARDILTRNKIPEVYLQCKEAGKMIIINHKTPIRMDAIVGNNPEEVPTISSQENKRKDFGNKPVFNFRNKDSYQNVTFADIGTIGGEECVVMINAQLTPVDATVHTIQVQLIYISVIMIVLSLLIALLVSKKISRSIVNVNQAAKELANGNFDVKFDGKDYKEITELSNTLNYAAKELGKAENLQREIIANISHDLRTPLTMVIAYSEVMRDLPGENSAENIQVVIDEARRLTNLVNDMLDISKLQAGVMDKKMHEYNLTKSIKSVITRYAKLIEQQGYNITFEYKENVIIEADEFKIYQVIYNLINNAINYTGEDKKVLINQVVRDNEVRIEVTDTGMGIQEEDIQYVWTRYYKVDKAHKRAIMGTGLGLSIVKNILELHGAKYGVVSEINKGSTFWFELTYIKKDL